MRRIALTVAGSDPSGGAGLQADLKTFHQHGVYGASVVTLLTVQNTRAVRDVRPIEAAFVRAQLDAVLSDLPPHAAKTGALGTAELVAEVARLAASFTFPLVVDPVMVSKHGDPLIAPDAIASFRSQLLPQAFLVTPNLAEASHLAEMRVEDLQSMQRAAARIADQGARHVLIKGGAGLAAAQDLFYSEGKVTLLEGERHATDQTHGSGCVFAAAITARLALGVPLLDAVRGAKQFITRAIGQPPGIGGGRGPVDMHAEI